MVRVKNYHSSVKKSSNHSKLIYKFIIICRGIVHPYVRVLVTVRLLKSLDARGAGMEGYLEAGLLLKTGTN